MTIADEARENAVPCEMVLYAYRKNNQGVVVSFVVHPDDMPDALATARIGSRWVGALVHVGDDEHPIPQAAKEPRNKSAAKLQPDKDVGREKRVWQDMKPSAQAAIRCGEPIFWAFLNEEHGYRVTNKEEAAPAVRAKCFVNSRKMLDDPKHHPNRVIWHQLDSGYIAWKALEHA